MEERAPTHGPRWSVDTRRVVGIMIVLSILLIIAIVLVPRNLAGLMQTASREKADYNLTMIVFSILAAPVFAFSVAFAGYSLFRFRSRGRPVRDGVPLRAGRGMQILWIGISTFLVLLLYIWGLVFLDRADAAPGPNANVLQVNVTGEQWNWDFTYPQYGNAQSEVLELPVNRPVLFKITSVDVVHEFGVPAFGIHEQANPGQFTYIRATPNTIGNYSVRCYELCGLFHAYMEAPAPVVSASAFATWVKAQPTGFAWPIAGAGVPNHYGEPGAPPSAKYPGQQKSSSSTGNGP